jgi:hypothetical protein
VLNVDLWEVRIMSELKIGDVVKWTENNQEFHGKVDRFLGEGGVFLDYGGTLPLQAKETDKGWRAYSGHGIFDIPIEKVGST